jgi:hypothetical protein
MMQIKLFRGNQHTTANIEDQVNNFLKECNEVIDVRVSTTTNTPSHVFGASTEQFVTVMVVYKD